MCVPRGPFALDRGVTGLEQQRARRWPGAAPGFSAPGATFLARRQTPEDFSSQWDRTEASPASRNSCTVLFAKCGNRGAAPWKGPCCPPARWSCRFPRVRRCAQTCATNANTRSEEHTSELQSRLHLVCRLLLEKKKN